jgi:hypothetical protein
LNVRANPSTKVGSAQIGVDGKTHVELQAPYALFFDLSGDYAAGTFSDGNHTITAKAFTGPNGTGTAGPSKAIHIHVINQSPPAVGAVTAIVLINADTGADVQTLKDFDTLDLSKLPKHLGIRSVTSGQVGSVVYVVDAHVGVPPANALKVGSHTLTALPFAGPNGTGTPGASKQLRLFITQSFDAARDFSATNNPNGVWRYGVSSTFGSALTPYNNNAKRQGVDSWSSSSIGVDPNVIFNQTGSNITIANTVPLHPGDLMFHPGPTGQFSHVLFTAPSAGSYTISGSFGGLDIFGTTTDVHVLVNHVERFSAEVTGARGVVAPFSLQPISLKSGDTVDFAVGFGTDGSYGDDSTLLTATIVPSS